MPTHAIGTQLIPLKQIHANPHQPRQHFDPLQLEELKQSIQERGLINPISVRERGQEFTAANATAATQYEIIAGERRYRCAQELGWDTIDCRIWPSTTSDREVELMALVENLQRDDLDPLEIAASYKVLVTAPFNLTYQQAAEQLGIADRSTISRYLALLDMPNEIQHLLSRGNITESHCRHLRKMTDKSTQIEFANRIEQDGWSVKQTEKEVLQRLGRKPKNGLKKRAPGKDPLASLWANTLGENKKTSSSWTVRYAQGGWQFHIPESKAASDPRECIAAWLRQMADLFPESARKI